MHGSTGLGRTTRSVQGEMHLDPWPRGVVQNTAAVRIVPGLGEPSLRSDRGGRRWTVSDRLLRAPNATRVELVRAFTKYTCAHRADLDLRATALIIPALSRAFPCQQRRAALRAQ